MLFLEHCPLGDLSSTVREHGAFDLVTTRSLLQQLLAAVGCLHRMDIVHRDIKGRNILLSLSGTTKALELKLADFGGSTKTTNDSPPCFGGTVHWMAPEVFMGSNVDDHPSSPNPNRLPLCMLPEAQM